MIVSLDCENRISTLNSISTIYDINPDIVEDFLINFDLEKHFENNYIEHTYDLELKNIFEKQLLCKPREILDCYWFHLCRTLPEEDFSDGILPLSIVIEKVWQTIHEVFKDTEHEKNLLHMQSNEINWEMYNTKLRVDRGPYAMLVGEAAYKPKEFGNYDYLKLPEIMRDICDAYHDKFEIRIHDDLSNSLVPTVVKFSSDKNTKSYLIQPALYYLYNTYKNQDFSWNSNTTFDGDNSIINPKQIQKISRIN